MKKLAFVFDDITTLTPVEIIRAMFKGTDADGMLYIPEWHYDNYHDDKEYYYACKMKWDASDCEKVVAEFENLSDAIKSIAEKEKGGELTDDYAENVRILGQKTADIWNAYIRPFDSGKYDTDKCDDIFDRRNDKLHVDDIAQKINNKEKLPDYEMEFYDNYKGVCITPTEEKYFIDYMDYLNAQSEKRIGNGICAHYVIQIAQRLRMLLILGAPEIIVNNEACYLAQGLVINKYGCSMETLASD